MQFVRTDLTDGAEETLTIVVSSDTYFSTWLETDSPYLVQVTQGEHCAGLFDLDGDQLTSPPTAWEVAEDVTLPPAVIAAVEEGWETAMHTVVRR